MHTLTHVYIDADSYMRNPVLGHSCFVISFMYTRVVLRC